MDGSEVLGQGGTVTGGSDSYTWDQDVDNPLTLTMSGGGSATASAYNLTLIDEVAQSMHDVGSDQLGLNDSITAGSDSYTHDQSRYQSSGGTDFGTPAHPYSLRTADVDSYQSQDQGTTTVSGAFSQSCDTYVHTEVAGNSAINTDASVSINGGYGGYSRSSAQGQAGDYYSNQDSGIIFQSSAGGDFQLDSFTLDTSHSLSYAVTGDLVQGTESDHFVDVEVDHSFLSAMGSTGTGMQDYNYTQGEDESDNFSSTKDSQGPSSTNPVGGGPTDPSGDGPPAPPAVISDHATGYDRSYHTDQEVGSVSGVNGQTFQQTRKAYDAAYQGFFDSYTSGTFSYSASRDSIDTLGETDVISGQPDTISSTRSPFSTVYSSPPDAVTPTGIFTGAGSARINTGIDTGDEGSYFGAIAYQGRESGSGDTSNGLVSALGSRGTNTLRTQGKPIAVVQGTMGDTTILYLAVGGGGGAWSAAPASPGYRRPGGGGGDVGPHATVPTDVENPSGTSGQAGDIAAAAGGTDPAPQNPTVAQPGPMPMADLDQPLTPTALPANYKPQPVFLAPPVQAPGDGSDGDAPTNGYWYQFDQLYPGARSAAVTYGPRAIQGVSGVVMVGVGVAASGTGFGALIGGPLALKGADNIQAALQGGDTLVVKLVKGAGGNKAVQIAADVVTDLGPGGVLSLAKAGVAGIKVLGNPKSGYVYSALGATGRAAEAAAEELAKEPGQVKAALGAAAADTVNTVSGALKGADTASDVAKAASVAPNNAVEYSGELSRNSSNSTRTLRNNLGTDSATQRPHHVIPLQASDHPVVQSGARGGFNINGGNNGINPDLAVHPQGARHPRYNSAVIGQLDNLAAQNLTNTQAAAALQAIVDRLRPGLGRLNQSGKPLR